MTNVVRQLDDRGSGVVELPMHSDGVQYMQMVKAVSVIVRGLIM